MAQSKCSLFKREERSQGKMGPKQDNNPAELPPNHAALCLALWLVITASSPLALRSPIFPTLPPATHGLFLGQLHSAHNFPKNRSHGPGLFNILEPSLQVNLHIHSLSHGIHFCDKTGLGEERVCVTYRLQSIMKRIQGRNSRRNLEAETEAETMEDTVSPW